MSKRSATTTLAGADAAPVPGSPAAELASKPGLRLRPYRPMRALVGAFMVIAGVVAALVIYTRLDDRIEVLVLTRDVMAGEEVTAGHIRVGELPADIDLDHVMAVDSGLVVGKYARVSMAAGDLIHANDVQEEPLISEGRALASVSIPFGRLPIELRERDRVWLVVTPPSGGGQPAPAVVVDAIVVSMPHNPGDIIGADSAGQGMIALTVDVPQEFAIVVGRAAAVSLLIVQPDVDEVPTQVDDVMAQPGATVVDAAATPIGASSDTTLPGSMTVPPSTSVPEGTQE